MHFSLGICSRAYPLSTWQGRGRLGAVSCSAGSSSLHPPPRSQAAWLELCRCSWAGVTSVCLWLRLFCLSTKANSGSSLRLPSPAACPAWVPASLSEGPQPSLLPATSPCPCRAGAPSPKSRSMCCSPASPRCAALSEARAGGSRGCATCPLPGLLLWLLGAHPHALWKDCWLQ